jgi:hypothetical protein
MRLTRPLCLAVGLAMRGAYGAYGGVGVLMPIRASSLMCAAMRTGSLVP